MKRLTMSNKGGFTIVELLIVIVIIGVLAALVIVAYNGVQQRAENSKVAAAVQAYKKALLQYATDKNSYPIASGGACLGEGYPSGCYGGQYSEVVAFNNLLRPYLGNGTLPLPSIKITDGRRGALFYGNAAQTIDGLPHTWFIWYVIQGAGIKCPVGPVVGGDFPTYTSNPASGYSVATANGTLCWVPMPDPSMV